MCKTYRLIFVQTKQKMNKNKPGAIAPGSFYGIGNGSQHRVKPTGIAKQFPLSNAFAFL